MTQKMLADEVSLSVGAISQIEQGYARPSNSVVEALAITLGFNPAFFFDTKVHEYTVDYCHFRSSRTATEKTRKQFLARGSLFARLVRLLREELILPEFRIPTLAVSDVAEAEYAADQCRLSLGLDLVSPIGHMGRVLENNGVMVVDVTGQSAKLDAFSASPSQPDGVGFVVLSDAKRSPSRARFDMAHELGHLVMHATRNCDLNERERQADRFASSFLMPRPGFQREFRTVSGRLDWPSVFAMKARWGTSVQAVIYRAYDLGLINAVELRRAYKLISARGWRKNEPNEPVPERPELFLAAMRLLAERRHLTEADVAARLHWSPDTFFDVTNWRRLTSEEQPALKVMKGTQSRVASG